MLNITHLYFILRGNTPMSKKVRMKRVHKVSFAKAIREKCLDCCCGQENEVRYCTAFDCPLFAYRFGIKPDTYIEHNQDKVIIVE